MRDYQAQAELHDQAMTGGTRVTTNRPTVVVVDDDSAVSGSLKFSWNWKDLRSASIATLLKPCRQAISMPAIALSSTTHAKDDRAGADRCVATAAHSHAGNSHYQPS